MTSRGTLVRSVLKPLMAALALVGVGGKLFEEIKAHPPSLAAIVGRYFQRLQLMEMPDRLVRSMVVS